MGSWLYGKSSSSVNNPSTPAAAFRVQTSIEGKPLPILWGQTRVAANLIWYGDFYPYAVYTPQSGSGGKGGGIFGGGPAQYQVTWTYYVSVAMAMCQGPINSIVSAWYNKSKGTAESFGFTVFLGDHTQSPWGYLTTNHPTEALAYRGVAYAAQQGFSLGSSTELPNFTWEVKSSISGGAPGIPDANPKDVWVDFLTNQYYGIGFPSARLDTVLTQWSNYSVALSLLVSPVLVDQTEGSKFLADLLTATNSSARWSGGILSVVPWGTDQVTANGVTYNPVVTPIYDLTDDNFLPNQGGSGSSGSEPIQSVRTRRSDLNNLVQVEYLDRNSDYDPVVVDAKDQAAIEDYGLRSTGVRSFHFLCLQAAAVMSASLQLDREQIPGTHTFTLPPKFILLDPEDLLTITRAVVGMDRYGVRITEIQENDDGSLTFTAEDFTGTASAPLYGSEASSGHSTNTNADPGLIRAPIIFEPTAELLGAATLEVWGAITGIDLSVWGGANVYASFDAGATYQKQDYQVFGPARMGALASALPSVSVNPTGQTVDVTNTLDVDLSISHGELLSGSQTDVTSLTTACYVGGEIVAYRDAALVTGNEYHLTYLVRGGYGTEDQITTHPIGTAFARLDPQGIFKVPFDQNRIGQTVYLKFQSFNLWGGGLQELSDLPIYQYVIQGTALTSPLSQVANVRTQFTDGFMYIYWDDVTDFRTGIRYKIFKGDTYAGAQQVGDNAHAPFIAFGTGTYWIVAYCQPVPGLYVYSEAQSSIEIAGNMLTPNLVYESDQQAAGWPGLFSNGVGIDGADIRLGGSGNVLTDADFLNTLDILNYGGTISEGFYEISSTDYVDVGYVANCYVNANWQCVGVPVGQDILSIADFLNQPDILGSASTQYINAVVQIATSSGDIGDLYAVSPDLYAISPDLYAYGIVWSDWVDFVPGVYRTRWVKLRLKLTTVDPNSICYVTAFSYRVAVPARIDHYPNFAVPGGGITVTYEPDDAAAAAPFNGGPPVGGSDHAQPLPTLNFSIVGQAGLTPVITAQDLASVTFHFEDSSGSHIDVANCTMLAEGF